MPSQAKDDPDLETFIDPPIHLVQLSDFHLLDDPLERLESGIAPEVRLEQVLAEVLAEGRPDLLLVTGDLTHRGSQSAYDRVAGHLASLGTPWYAIPGNHDDPHAMRRRFGGELMPEMIQAGSWRILLVDSTVAGEPSGRLSPHAEVRIEEALTRDPAPPTLIALHHPPLATGTAWLDAIGLANPELLMRHLSPARGIRGVLSGHLHQDFERVSRGIVYYGCPSTAMQFLQGTPRPATDTGRGGWRSFSLHPTGRIESRIHWVDFSDEVLR